MKTNLFRLKHFLPGMFCLAAATSFAQNTPWGTTVNYLTGIGITTPVHPLHIHATQNYVLGNVNYGLSSWIGFTTPTTGTTNLDGLVMRLTGRNFAVDNMDGGNILLTTNAVSMTLNGTLNRVLVGSHGINSTTTYGMFNVRPTSDNGIYVSTHSAGRYGLSVKMHTNTDNAMQVVSPVAGKFGFFSKPNGQAGIYASGLASGDDVLVVENDTRRILQLENSGLLYAREVKVDANTWSDYVFEPGYELMPLEEVEQYIEKEGHLPGVPSTEEVTRDGVNVATMDAILLEKIEGLTLYILELSKENKELKQRISSLEQK